MAKKEPARPYFDVRHEYDASMQAYQSAVSMLHSAVSTAVQLAKTPEQAMRLIATLKEHNDAFHKAAFGDD